MSTKKNKTTDILFRTIEELQGDTPWGRFLDAGTGEHSLAWVAGLETEQWTAVSIEPSILDRVEANIGPFKRDQDRIASGNWTDPSFCQNEVYDTVLADYLLGAIDGFAPYFQDQLFERLRPHVGQRLYIIGLEPIPHSSTDPDQQLLIELARTRDACILLGGDRMYREYPSAWVERHLERAGFIVESVQHFGNIFRERYVRGQIETARYKLPAFQDDHVRDAMKKRLDALWKTAQNHEGLRKGISLGSDYVIAARPV